MKTPFLLLLSLLIYESFAYAGGSAGAQAEQVVQDYFAAFKAYHEAKTYALIEGAQEDMLRRSQGDMDFQTWVDNNNIRPKSVSVECSYCEVSQCKVLVHVALERHSGTQGDDVIFVVNAADAPENALKIVESYIDPNESAKLRSQPAVCKAPLAQSLKTQTSGLAKAETESSTFFSKADFLR
jgi:hypothetical protein